MDNFKEMKIAIINSIKCIIHYLNRVHPPSAHPKITINLKEKKLNNLPQYCMICHS